MKLNIRLLIPFVYIKSRIQVMDALKVLLKALKIKNKYTYYHSIRTARYSVKIGKALKFTQARLFTLEVSALLHDIGKLTIQDQILESTKKLTKEQKKAMNKHVINGYNILHSSKNLKKFARYIKYHHERFDGKGYPDKLKGTKIPLISRIIFIADAFDAMTTKRMYNKVHSKNRAIKLLQYNAGTQFDKKLVRLFVNSFYKRNK